MKTHEFAKALMQLARALQAGPDVELGDVKIGPTATNGNRASPDVPLALQTLAALSSFDKKQWMAIIEENNLPIDVLPRDSTRNIVGKLLNVLAKDAEARERLQNNIKKRTSRSSPQLLRALEALLEG